MTARLSVALCCSGLWLAACGTTPPAVELTTGYASAGTPYGKLLPSYTRKAELYDGFDTVAKGVATWRSSALRRAAVVASVERYHLDAEAARDLEMAQEQATRTTQEFHLALYTPKKQWNDLESPETLWRAYLELPGGERLEPIDVAFVRKTDKSSVEYPYVTPWTREYRLRFPVSRVDAADAHPTLVLAGVLGTLRFGY